MRQIPVKIWLPIILAATMAVGLAVFFTFPREEKAPQVLIPEKTPRAEEITPPEGIVWNVPEGQVDPEIEGEIKKIVFEHFPTEPMVWGEKQVIISIENLKVEGDWAIIEHAPRYKESGEFVGTEGSLELLQKTDDKWRMISDQNEFCKLLPQVPETLIPTSVKEFYLDGCPF